MTFLLNYHRRYTRIVYNVILEDRFKRNFETCLKKRERKRERENILVDSLSNLRQ